MYSTPAQRRRRRRQRRTILALTLAATMVAGMILARSVQARDVSAVGETPTADQVLAATTAPATTGKPTTTSTTMKLVRAQHPTQVAQGLDAYRGLGVWVDLYDVGPGAPFQPSSVADVAARGARTIYLQAARVGGMADREVLGPILVAAHQHNVAVVAWYLPEFSDVNTDVLRVEQIHKFEYQGHRFDGLSIDIEDEYHVPDHKQRSARLVEFSKKMRTKLPADYPVAACILPPAQIEVVSLNYWPDFPYKEIDPYYQVWQPMGYWTDRTQGSGYRDAYDYTRDSIELLRTRLGRADVLVHPIGGQAAKTTEQDLRDFRRAANDMHAIGLSIYDYNTTSRKLWDVLTELPPSADPAGPMPTMPRMPAAPVTTAAPAAPAAPGSSVPPAPGSPPASAGPNPGPTNPAPTGPAPSPVPPANASDGSTTLP